MNRGAKVLEPRTNPSLEEIKRFALGKIKRPYLLKFKIESPLDSGMIIAR